MRRAIERILLLTLAIFCLGASSCYVSGGATVGYGYSHGYYDDVFYRSPMDRYGYGFYGHP